MYVLTEGKRNFVISDSVYYQFCEATSMATPNPSHITRLDSAAYDQQSL